MMVDKNESDKMAVARAAGEKFFGRNGKQKDVNELQANYVKQDLNKGDFTRILLEYAASRKPVVLHTWVYKGMVGVVLRVDIQGRLFKFYNARHKTNSYYSINVVRGLDEYVESESESD
jgi:hypothetical protein